MPFIQLALFKDAGHEKLKELNERDKLANQRIQGNWTLVQRVKRDEFGCLVKQCNVVLDRFSPLRGGKEH